METSCRFALALGNVCFWRQLFCTSALSFQIAPFDREYFLSWVLLHQKCLRDAFFYAHSVCEALLSEGFHHCYEFCFELPLVLAAWFYAQLLFKVLEDVWAPVLRDSFRMILIFATGFISLIIVVRGGDCNAMWERILQKVLGHPSGVCLSVLVHGCSIK